MTSGGQRLGLTQTQRLGLNTSLQASLFILRSDAAGLTRYLEEQAAENPCLRLEPVLPAAGDWLPRWSGMLAAPGVGNADQAESAAPSLIAHVLAAIDAARLSAPQQAIALALTEGLDPSGWFVGSLDAIAADLARPLTEVESVLDRLQAIEPAGLFARTLAECLRLQARADGLLDAPMQTVLDNLDLLARGDLARLARKGKLAEAEVQRRFAQIRAMNPKPGAGFDPIAAVTRREPDLTARCEGGHWLVSLNRSALPAVRIAAGAGDAAQLATARALRHAVAARNDTLLRVAAEIVRRQAAALELGPIALLPMSMADVARALDLHESTISRVVAGASLDTPRGINWLRQMFSPALGEASPQSAAAMRARLGRAIAGENPQAPLSDAALVAVLAGETGVTLARRTVAKYRESLGLPTAARRKRQHALTKLPRMAAKSRARG